MGPLWAWVIVWLVSAYGLVLLLRRSLSQEATEPVPVLVATPKPAEPASVEPEPDEALTDVVTSEDEPAEPILGDEALAPTELASAISSTLPALEEEPVAPPDDTLDELLTPFGQAVEEEPGLMPGMEPEALETTLPAMEEAPAEELPEPERPTVVSLEAEAGVAPNEPWIREPEEAVANEPWIKEREERTADDPWIKEHEVGIVSDPWRPDGEEDLPAPATVLVDEEEDVVYRSIDLEALTLGLEAAEIQALYGSPGHLSKLGADGEQWRYPLNGADEQGVGVEGVLVLEFQRGRLVRKSFEESRLES